MQQGSRGHEAATGLGLVTPETIADDALSNDDTRSGIITMRGHWTVETLNETVDAELAALPDDMRARFMRIAELISSGPDYRRCESPTSSTFGALYGR